MRITPSTFHTEPTPVQSLWVGELLGPLQQLGIRSFLARGHRYDLYTYGPVAGVPEGTTICDATAIVPEREVFANGHGFGAGSYAAFSDLFRYHLLYTAGGWWVDTDVVCLRPFNDLPGLVFAAELSRSGLPTTATCAMRSPAGSEHLRYCIEVCAATCHDALTWGQIGPELLDDALWRFDLGRHRMPVDAFNPINYFDVRAFLSRGFDLSRLHRSWGVHLWNQMWLTLDLDPVKEVSPDSLLGMICDQLLGLPIAYSLGISPSIAHA